MQFTFSKGPPEVPENKYTARFDGIELLKDTGFKDKDGNPLPPGMAWRFCVTEGEHAGRKVDRVTGREPTPKSGCGKMLAAITDQILRDGQQYDVSQFVGKLYRITVETKPNGNGTRVSDNPAPVRVYDGAPAAPTPPAGGPPRPPRPAVARYWFAGKDGAADPIIKTEDEVRDLILASDADAKSTPLCPEGGSDWKPIGEVIPALKDTIPF